MTSFSPLPATLIEPIVRVALLEDLGRSGDLTTDAVIPYDCTATLVLKARQAGVVAGLDLVSYAFLLVEPAINIQIWRPDGSEVGAGETIARLSGPARGLLTAERTALNFLCRLSGIATATAAMVEAVRGHKARIVSTRKTTPGLRALEKYAVRVGGGANHRFGLDDGVLIKDNHIAIAGDIRTAIERARAAAGHMVKVEVEVDTLKQLDAALAIGVDAVLLDNMSVEDLARAVSIVDGRTITEASGRVMPKTAAAIAATGVDLISMGWLTHSAPILDIGLDMPDHQNICKHLN
ncbi:MULTISPECIES: carboxylating nicotinate-nucleotide diphosphorylase [Mesorhizobium]|uniref:Probable nicotinate-nucleotide pyrophosphorylase [carboxylating] n=5 Tax=Mesorhizobium TaxID=68287 RepID=A0AB36R7M3_9HYPH|nr:MULTISPECIES: carboxylating nicotinate-nucleotide diphosphorylase [Mesorhizobium]RUU83060.1 carboxylating nicotinate-nucleotide diphosphorylase [Mesorhizobium sp. M7A.T.Ca.TU.009.01.1.2]RUV51999.1 carboxylating nicotinate-nucleotide diphosphorylase [Mesorhizobium sp. M7A.F.Ca.MR.228.00.0.0]RUW99203.1 carboxylating nicotinate-nucleotide diphosphorylase [Mesorhizobium sp. M8A.F.Ca.ET.059.01.1.1]RUX06526.1 carboxylating nicotinate-nucleotide diphosphorylase [Mesorhizobium sp. M8A.F.Ca.ET.023.01